MIVVDAPISLLIPPPCALTPITHMAWLFEITLCLMVKIAAGVILDATTFGARCFANCLIAGHVRLVKREIAVVVDSSARNEKGVRPIRGDGAVFEREVARVHDPAAKTSPSRDRP